MHAKTQGGALLQVAIFLLLWIGLAFKAEAATPSLTIFDPVRQAVVTGNLSQALEALDKVPKEELSADLEGLVYFARGILLFDHDPNQAEQAEANLLKALNSASYFSPYIHFYLGHIYQRLNKPEKADKAYAEVVRAQATNQIVYESRYHLSALAMQRSHWVTAATHLEFLERRWRSSNYYPEILWRLVQVELERNRKWVACRWARRLYANHPEHPIVHDWGIDLQNVEVGKTKLGCIPTMSDQTQRIRRLQWAGESVRARRELESLRGKVKGDALFDVESRMVTFLVNEGFVDEALKLLLPYHDTQKNNIEYYRLLSRAAARAGELETAVGAYRKTNQMSPQSATGREALFHSAFLSYQFQDYDGASRTFEEFIKKYPRSGLSRDSQWYLAWMNYLRGDYPQAIKSFENILSARKRAPRAWRRYPEEMMQYWMAMSHLRMKNVSKAKGLFNEIIEKKSFSYYSYAAQARREALPEASEEEALERGLAQSESVNVLLENTIVTHSDVNDGELVAIGEEDESEETIGAANEGAEDVILSTSLEPEDLESGPVLVTEFKDPQLQKRFSGATQLIALGLHSWARWELYEIERRTRNQSYLRLLIRAYQGIEAYHRSAYISEIHFASQRQRYGVDGIRYLWEHAYPKAYQTYVEKYAQQFVVDPYFVWSIMKAESSFRADISSPVGAHGLMQLMPNTARQVASMVGETGFRVTQLSEPQMNIQLGTRYLNRLGKMFKSTLPLMAAGYNAGPHRVEAWLNQFGSLEMDEFIEHIPFIETRNYVKRVSRFYGTYKKIYDSSDRPLNWLQEPVGITISGRPATRETWESL